MLQLFENKCGKFKVADNQSALCCKNVKVVNKIAKVKKNRENIGGDFFRIFFSCSKFKSVSTQSQEILAQD